MKGGAGLNALSYFATPLLSVAMLSSSGEGRVGAEEPSARVTQTIQDTRPMHAAVAADALSAANQVAPVNLSAVNAEVARFVRKTNESFDLFGQSPWLRRLPSYRDLPDTKLSLTKEEERAFSLLLIKLAKAGDSKYSPEHYLLVFRSALDKGFLTVKELEALIKSLLGCDSPEAVVGFIEEANRIKVIISPSSTKNEDRIATIVKARKFLGLPGEAEISKEGLADVSGLIAGASLPRNTESVVVVGSSDPMTLAVTPMIMD